MTYENNLILVEKRGPVALVTINIPPMNLNSIASITELAKDFHALAMDEDVRAVVLTGSGTRAFCVGTDVKEMQKLQGDIKGRKFYLETTMMDLIEFLPKPTICAIEGYCFGGGLELACCCDIRIASEKASFGQPEIKLGLYPAAGGIYRLPKLIGPSRALEMMYLGEPINAGEAERLGLVNHVVADGAACAYSIRMAERIAEMAPNALRVIKEGVRRTWQKESTENHYTNLEYIDRIFENFNGREGVSAFIEKRKPNFDYRQ